MTPHESGWQTGALRAKHDLAIAPMFAIQQMALQSGPYGISPRGEWERGYVAGYRVMVQRYLC